MDIKAIIIYPDDIKRVAIPQDDMLKSLQGIVGGYIEAVPLPSFISGAGEATAYINEEGKYLDNCKTNMLATDFMVPGVGLFPGDYIAGPFVLVGFDITTGEHTPDLPDGVKNRVRIIEREGLGR